MNGIYAGLIPVIANWFYATGVGWPVLQFLPSTPLECSASQPQLKYNCSRNEVKDDQREDLLMFQRADHPRSVPSEARPPCWQECQRGDQNN